MKKSIDKSLRPESLMMSHGYEPSKAEGSVKPPIFQTSTFEFESAKIGERNFELAYDMEEPEDGEEIGNIYSRLDNPNLQILEQRLRVWDNTEDCAVFSSGLAAITSVFFTFLRPEDVLIHSIPLYGGTDHFIENFLEQYGIKTIGFRPGDDEDKLKALGKEHIDKVKMIYVETPANPTNSLIDLEMCKRVAKHFSNKQKEVILAVDNTYMGPVWSKPMSMWADLVLYSATKYIGGHSDLIAGACLGNKELIKSVKKFRTLTGNMADAWTSWLMTRSLETIKIRMDQQAKNANIIAKRLDNHPNVERVYYLGLIKETDSSYEIYQKQYTSPGAMISFDVKGGKEAAYSFLDSINLVKLAVSLGGTESLAEHPYNMTHLPVDPQRKIGLGFTDKMIRLSVGLENVEDIWNDISQALS